MTKDATATDFEDFFESARTGFIIAEPNGQIRHANARVAEWLGLPLPALQGTRFTDHLPIAGKVYFETHLAPLLRMQGFIEEIALELAPPRGTRLPVLVNAVERRDAAGVPLLVAFTIFRAVDRRQYEQELLRARAAALTDSTALRETAALREQFIAVLGHDLRNPLAAISGGMNLLAKTPLNEKALTITALIEKSVGRMAGLIDNVMDFARARLGGGLSLQRRPTFLEPLIRHAIEELQIAFPERSIGINLAVTEPIQCDPHRVSQVLSNLLANALTHGAAGAPVRVSAAIQSGELELAVRNTGEPIPPEALPRLFLPFTREDVRPSQEGLGLGLFISAEIAKAHGGTLSVQSFPAETCFTLRIPVA
jgi:sigma-B regulation protein RsbU (phosphoserine phosphatase)